MEIEGNLSMSATQPAQSAPSHTENHIPRSDAFTHAQQNLVALSESVRNNTSEHQREYRAEMILRLARVINPSAVLNAAQTSLVNEAVSRFAYRFNGSENMANEDYYYATIRESESLMLLASFINSCRPD